MPTESLRPSRKAEPARALEEQLCFALYTSANAMTRAYTPLLAPHGLTYPQYLVLLVLWEGEALAVGELGARLSLKSATLTPLLKRLEAAGLVARRRDGTDERVVNVSLTAKGRALEKMLARVPGAIFCRTALSARALATLRSDLRALAGRLEAVDVAPASRQR